MSGACLDLCSLLFLRLWFRLILCYCYSYVLRSPMQRFCSARGVSDIYASTDSLHVLDLIGSDYTAFGIDCTAYLCNVASDMYEYTFDTSSVHHPVFSWDCDMPRLPFLGCDDYESTWRAYCVDYRTAWPYRYLCVDLVWMRFKWRKRRSDIISCLKEHKVLLCWTVITQTPVLL